MNIECHVVHIAWEPLHRHHELIWWKRIEHKSRKQQMGRESCTPRRSKRNYSLSIFELHDETVLFILYRSHIRQWWIEILSRIASRQCKRNYKNTILFNIFSSLGRFYSLNRSFETSEILRLIPSSRRSIFSSQESSQWNFETWVTV